MSIRDLIPKDKHDLDAVRKIKQHSANEINDILPELFEWLQDINWPVAGELTKILPQFGDILLPHIRTVLRSNDPQWQFSLLQFLIRELPRDTSLQLTDAIQRIADTPTQAEMLEEVHILAKEMLRDT
ncbi:DUF5071 domain-containing protein [Paenibacillus athensensis]|nr:DUF5071 domain-containing protein [Paenibacillus athensensis]MCD1261258.1 DUF5071 domain-containing protein [Paenibacillus athensensis]